MSLHPKTIHECKGHQLAGVLSVFSTPSKIIFWLLTIVMHPTLCKIQKLILVAHFGVSIFCNFAKGSLNYEWGIGVELGVLNSMGHTRALLTGSYTHGAIGGGLQLGVYGAALSGLHPRLHTSKGLHPGGYTQRGVQLGSGECIRLTTTPKNYIRRGFCTRESTFGGGPRATFRE